MGKRVRTEDASTHHCILLGGCRDVGCRPCCTWHCCSMQFECRQPSSYFPNKFLKIVVNLKVSRSVSPVSGSKWGKSYCGSEKISGPSAHNFSNHGPDKAYE